MDYNGTSNSINSSSMNSTGTEKLNNHLYNPYPHHPYPHPPTKPLPNPYSSLETNLFHLRNLFQVNQDRFDPSLLNEINTLFSNLATDAAVLLTSTTGHSNSSSGSNGSNIVNHAYHSRHRTTRAGMTGTSSSSASSSSDSSSSSTISSPSSPSSTNAHPPPSNTISASSSSNLLSNKDTSSQYRSSHHYINNSDDAASTKAIQGSGRQTSRRRGRYTVSFSMNHNNNNNNDSNTTNNNTSSSSYSNSGTNSTNNRSSRYPPIVPPVQEQDDEDQDCHSDTAVADEQDQLRLLSRNHHRKIPLPLSKSTIPLSDDADSNSHEEDDDDNHPNDSEDYDATDNKIPTNHRSAANGMRIGPSLPLNTNTNNSTKSSSVIHSNNLNSSTTNNPNFSSSSTSASTVQGNSMVLRRVQEQEDVGDTDVPGTWADRRQHGTTEAWTPAMVAGHLANLLDRSTSYRPYHHQSINMNTLSGISSSSSAVTGDSSSVSRVVHNSYEHSKRVSGASNQAVDDGTVDDVEDGDHGIGSNSENEDDAQGDDASRAVATAFSTHRLSTGSISGDDSVSTMSVEHDEVMGDEDQNSYPDHHGTVSNRYTTFNGNSSKRTQNHSVNNSTAHENGTHFHPRGAVGSVGEQGRLSVASRNSQSARGSTSYGIPSVFVPTTVKNLRNDGVDEILSTNSNPFMSADEYAERTNDLPHNPQDTIEGRGSAAAERGSERSDNEDNVSVTHSEDNPIIPHLRDDSDTDSIDINTTVEQSAVEYAFDRDYGDADLRPPVQRVPSTSTTIRVSPTKKSTVPLVHPSSGYSTSMNATVPVDTRLARNTVTSNNYTSNPYSSIASSYPLSSSSPSPKRTESSVKRIDNVSGKPNATNENYVLQTAWRRANTAGDIWQSTATTSVSAPAPGRHSSTTARPTDNNYPGHQSKTGTVQPPALPSINNGYNRSSMEYNTQRSRRTEQPVVTSSSDDDDDDDEKYFTQSSSTAYDNVVRNNHSNTSSSTRKGPVSSTSSRILARPGSAKPRRNIGGITGSVHSPYTEETIEGTLVRRTSGTVDSNDHHHGTVRNIPQNSHPTRSTPNAQIPGYVARAGSAGLLSDNHHHHHHHYHHSNTSSTVYPSPSLEDNYSSSSRNYNTSLGHNPSSEHTHGRHSHRPVWSASSAVRRGTVLAATMDLDAVEAAADINFGPKRINKLTTRRSSDGGGGTIMHNV